MIELWNIIGLVGFFGFIILAIFSAVIALTAKKKPDFYIISAGVLLLLFVGSILFFPGEEEIAEAIGNPQKIYSRGLENEKAGAFDRAEKDYEIVLQIDPKNEKAINRLELIGRREIALTFLERGKRLMIKGKFAQALVKLKMAESIAPEIDALNENSPLKEKIKLQIKRAQEFVSEEKNGFSY